jgi:hypothetical protein
VTRKQRVPHISPRFLRGDVGRICPVRHVPRFEVFLHYGPPSHISLRGIWGTLFGFVPHRIVIPGFHSID